MAAANLQGLFSGLFYQMLVRRHLGSVIKERGVGSGVLWPMLTDRVDVASVGYNSRIFLQRFQQRHGFLL
jgi:hypothetical protein